MDSESTFIRHEPCPGCGSRDNLARYSDGHGHCFGCGRYEKASGDQEEPSVEGGEKYVYEAIPSRKLTEETCRKFSYGIGRKQDGTHVQVASYRNAAGEEVAWKWRDKDKNFGWTGAKKATVLFGQHLWGPGKNLVVTEGEIDAMTVSQIQGHKWPVVSVPDGAAGALKAITANLEWLEKFERVVFMFDMDKPGQEAARECAAVLSPGKASIASLPLKDPNDCLKAGRAEEVVKAFWNAKPWRPDEIVSGDDIWEKVLRAPEVSHVRYPWECFNRMTMGLRTRELVTVCAASGVGKSTVSREIAYSLLMSGEKVGYIGLEESVRSTALELMGLHMDRRVRVETARDGMGAVDIGELRRAFDEIGGRDRLHLYDHFGSVDAKNLAARMRYMAKGLGCRWLFLDHISIVVSGSESDNERKDIDRAVTSFRTLIEECDVGMVMVSHVSRPKDKSEFEEGGVPRKSDLRGSAALEQLSDIILSFGRNGCSEDRPNTMEAWCIKNRFSGDLGHMGDLEYRKDTGRLVVAGSFEGQPAERSLVTVGQTTPDF